MKQARENVFGMSGDVDKWIRGDVRPLAGGMFDFQPDRYIAEEKSESERYAAQMLRLQEAYSGRLEYVAEQYLLEEDLAREHAARMNQIDTARNLLMLSTAESGFASLAESMKGAQGEATGAYKALFAVSKAFAIAQASIGLSNAISNAMALPFLQTLRLRRRRQGTWARFCPISNRLQQASQMVAIPAQVASISLLASCMQARACCLKTICGRWAGLELSRHSAGPCTLATLLAAWWVLQCLRQCGATMRPSCGGRHPSSTSSRTPARPARSSRRRTLTAATPRTCLFAISATAAKRRLRWRQLTGWYAEDDRWQSLQTLTGRRVPLRAA